ncbi:MAG: hypothetical protein IIC69_01300 [Nanoarchaeota archaeon]|nr:hypothetical protein [Nanoarchaeota archaeon]
MKEDRQAQHTGQREDDGEMLQLFKLVFAVGTSAYWENDRELATELNKVYWALDNRDIKSWINQEQ